MNYRHIFHAGNFADVFKHWILTLLLEKLLEKPTPFCVLDSHAGLGVYDLTHVNAQKTLEQDSGVQRILSKAIDPAFQAYYKVLTTNNQPTTTYPGSPKIIQAMLRDTDRLFAVELHPEDYLSLKNNFNNDKRIKTMQQNGYQAIRALLPPLENRGLVFIDPPFEEPDEFEQIISALQAGLKRFAHGIYAIWYPIKDITQVANFYADLKTLQLKKCMIIELHANNLNIKQLNSCGMVIINPPWKIDDTLAANLPKLLNYLEFTHGSFKITLTS